MTHIIKQTEKMEAGLLVGLAEIAAFLHLNQRTVSGLIRTGGIPATKIGLHWMASRNQIVAWVEARAAGKVTNA